MQIRSLGHFITLAQAGSFYQAAKRSDLSVQGFAKMVDSLERELGVVLVTRGRSGIRLTHAGEILLEYALQAVEGFDSATARIQELRGRSGEEAGRIVVYATHYAMQLISQTESVYSSLSGYAFYEEPFDKILIRAMNARPNDIIIADVFTDEALLEMDRRNIAFETLFESALGLIVRNDCPLAQLEVLSIPDLGSLKMSVYHHKERIYLAERVLKGQISKYVFFESTALNLLIDYVKASPNRGLLADSLSMYSLQRGSLYDVSSLRFIPLKGESMRFGLGLLHCRGQEPSPEASALIDMQRKELGLQFADYFEELERINRMQCGK